MQYIQWFAYNIPVVKSITNSSCNYINNSTNINTNNVIIITTTSINNNNNIKIISQIRCGPFAWCHGGCRWFLSCTCWCKCRWWAGKQQLKVLWPHHTQCLVLCCGAASILPNEERGQGTFYHTGVEDLRTPASRPAIFSFLRKLRHPWAFFELDRHHDLCRLHLQLHLLQEKPSCAGEDCWSWVQLGIVNPHRNTLISFHQMMFGPHHKFLLSALFLNPFCSFVEFYQMGL